MPLGLLSFSPPRRARPPRLLDTVKVDSADTTVTKGSASLSKGRTYTLRVSGTFSEVAANGIGYRFDALFCTVGLGAAKADCMDHPRAANFRVTTGENAYKDIDLFGGPLQDYDASHAYTVRFNPPASGVLRAGMSRAYKPCASCAERANGTITVEVHGQAHKSSGSGTSSGSSGSIGPAARRFPRIIRRATGQPACRRCREQALVPVRRPRRAPAAEAGQRRRRRLGAAERLDALAHPHSRHAGPDG